LAGPLSLSRRRLSHRHREEAAIFEAFRQRLHGAQIGQISINSMKA